MVVSMFHLLTLSILAVFVRFPLLCLSVLGTVSVLLVSLGIIMTFFFQLVMSLELLTLQCHL